MNADETYAQALEVFKDGSTVEASRMLEKARADYLARSDNAKAALVGNDLGVVYYRIGRLEDAQKILLECQAAFEKSGDVPGQARVLGNLAQVLNRLDEPTNAAKSYERSAELFHQAKDRVAEYETLRALSQMHMRRGRWLESLSAYERALAAKGGSSLLRAILRIPLRLLGLR